MSITRSPVVKLLHLDASSNVSKQKGQATANLGPVLGSLVHALKSRRSFHVVPSTTSPPAAFKHRLRSRTRSHLHELDARDGLEIARGSSKM